MEGSRWILEVSRQGKGSCRHMDEEGEEAGEVKVGPKVSAHEGVGLFTESKRGGRSRKRGWRITWRCLAELGVGSRPHGSSSGVRTGLERHTSELEPQDLMRSPREQAQEKQRILWSEPGDTNTSQVTKGACQAPSCLKPPSGLPADA